MKHTLTALLALYAITSSCSIRSEHDELSNEISNYIDQCDAEIGVAVIIDNSDTISVNDGIPYPMNSVLKLYQAVAVTDFLAKNNISLDSLIAVDRNELKEGTHSPMRDEHPVSNLNISLADIIGYSIRQSDNNACDILFDHIVGIAETDSCIRNLGINEFSIKYGENDMHIDPVRANDNHTSPLASAMLINRIYTDSLRDTPLRKFLCNTLDGCSTGQERLAKPLLHTDAEIGHKTGTGFPDSKGNPQGINDVGYIRLPDGHSYSIAVFIRSSHTDMSNTERMIADISDIVYTHCCNRLQPIIK